MTPYFAIVIGVLSFSAEAALVPMGGTLEGSELVSLDENYGSFSAAAANTICELQGPFGEVCATAQANIRADISAKRLGLFATGNSASLITGGAGAGVSGDISFQLTTTQEWLLELDDGTPIYGEFAANLTSAGGTIWSAFGGWFDDSKTQSTRFKLPAGEYNLNLAFFAHTTVGTSGSANLGISLSAVPLPPALWLFSSVFALMGAAERIRQRHLANFR